MRKRKAIKLILPAFLLAVTVFIVYWPKSSGALNPNHDCASCHNTHNAPGQSLTNNLVVEDLCLSCHGSAGTSSLKAEIHKNKPSSSYPAFTMTCVDCHDPHDSLDNWLIGTNIKMVGYDADGSGDAKIGTPNSGDRDVVFESRGTDAGGPALHSFADGDQDANSVYDGACEVCHTQANFHRNNSSGSHDHEKGRTCTVCHPHNSYFNAAGGSCNTCHSTIFDTEFTQTSHHVAAGSVTEDDCQVCHREPTANHMDGSIDLRDPDDGSALTPFAKGSTRNTASDTLESWVVEVQNNLCMKCHDSDGALNTNFSGNPLRPFSVGSRDVPNVFDRFDTGNSYHHAVRGAGTNPYCNVDTMEPPWNQAGDHDVISCFDCHEASGHGGANQRMLRNAIDFDTMESATVKGDLPAGMGVSVEAFCIRCHKSSEYVGGGSNSIFEFHGANQNQHQGSPSNELGCMGCHGGIVNMWHDKGTPLPNGHARGNIHGGNFTWGPDSFADGTATEHFMVGGWNSGWQIVGSTGYCRGGDCNHSNSSKDYTR